MQRCPHSLPGSLWRALASAAFALTPALHAAILWSDPNARVVHDSGDGADILGGFVKRDDSAKDTLYFKFHVDPLSDISTEEYYAGFQLFEGGEKHLAIGNAPKAWAYSAFYTSDTGPSNKVSGDFDLHSARPEPVAVGAFKPYELPRQGKPRTIVFRVQFVPNDDDLVTVWLSPDLTRGATDESQLEILTTRFKANASFDQIRLRHVGGGNGWVFSDMAVATSFDDFVITHFWESGWFLALAALGLFGVAGITFRIVEKRKFQRRLQLAEQERALERERARIAQDLHDDLGSSLTRISLLSDLTRSDKHDPAQVEAHVEKISQSAAQSLRSLEEIVWAIRPASDSLQSLVEYIAHVANEMFAGSQTRCRLNLPPDLPPRPLPPEMRHNILLVVKEALTNALKHAGATEVHVEAKASANALEIIVRDDGRGFSAASPPADGQHNGLQNMRQRASTINAQLDVESAPARGTTIRLAVDFPNGVPPG
jgi:signal transduction histidine kinase